MEDLTTVLVAIEGEPFLSRAKAYRDALHAREVDLSKWGEEIGASGMNHRVDGFWFNGKARPPAGWKRPDSKGFSTPKKGHAALERFKSLPPNPDAYAVFGDALLYDISYSGPHGRGSSVIGQFWFGPRLGWAGDFFFAYIPHAGRAAAARLMQDPGATITTPGALGWEVPVGLREISEARKDLRVAEYRVAQEQTAEAAE